MMSESSPTVVHDDAAISEYEKVRLENIKRNEEYLRSVGIERKQGAKEETKVTKSSSRNKRQKRKRKSCGEDSSSDDHDDDEEDDEDEPAPYLQPVRRSRRNTPQTADGEGDNGEPFQHIELSADLKSQRPRRSMPSMSSAVRGAVDGAIEDEEDVGRKRITAASLRDFIDTASMAHSDAISDEQVVHCAHRFSYMSNKALANRLKMITRAAGAKAREKVLVFMYALKASGLEQMAAAAEEALKGLGTVID